MGLALSVVSWQHFHRTAWQRRMISKQQEILEQMAYRDSLTRLPNRRALDDLVQREVELVERKQTESCLTYGHVAGDDLLKAFATQLLQNTRSNNTLVRLIIIPLRSLLVLALRRRCGKLGASSIGHRQEKEAVWH